MEGRGLLPIRNIATRGGVLDLTLQALMLEMEHMFDWKLKPIQEQLDRVEERGQWERTPQSPWREWGRSRFNQNDLNDLSEMKSDQGLN